MADIAGALDAAWAVVEAYDEARRVEDPKAAQRLVDEGDDHLVALGRALRRLGPTSSRPVGALNNCDEANKKDHQND